MEGWPRLLDATPARPRAGSTLITVSNVVTADSPGGIVDLQITRPATGSTESVYSLGLEGWVVPAASPARAIRVHGAHRPLPHAPVVIDRPDVAALYPAVAWAGRAGFAARLNALQLPRRFRLRLTALLENGERARLATIEGERRPLPAQDTRYRPLIVTTIGRSGSTWLTWLLGRHPDIVDYRSFEYETKVAAYFAEALRALSKPASYYQPMRGEVDYSGWWRGEPTWSLFWHTSHESIDEWLGTEHVEDLIEFFAGRMDALFGRLAQAIGKADAAYVVEKMPPTYFGQPLLAEILPAGREIIIVRDFRDVAASLLAFGEKRGKKWYEDRPDLSDEEIISVPLRSDMDQLADSWAERKESAFLLRYEDLVLRPEETLAGALSYLELDALPQTVSRMLADAARVDGEMQDAHVTSPTAEGSIGRWRNDLSPTLQRICEESLGDGLQTFGYA
jgi:hypothetical protein